MTSPSLPQAMSAERIEKAARAIALRAGYGIWPIPEECAAPGGVHRYMRVLRRSAEAALRAAYPELADGSSVIAPKQVMTVDVYREIFEGTHWIAPWEPSREMLRAWDDTVAEACDYSTAELDWRAMRDAYLGGFGDE